MSSIWIISSTVNNNKDNGNHKDSIHFNIEVQSLPFRCKVWIGVQKFRPFLMSVFTFRLSKLASRHRLRSHSHRVLSGLKGRINWCAFPSSFKFTLQVRGFHLGFQTQENWWKHEAAGRVFLLFSSVWKPWWNPMHEF